MKKCIKGILTGIAVIAAVYSVHAMAADKAHEAVYTDIKLNLNGVVIPCYNVDNYVVITAEDLGHYGFDVNWNNADRKLYISRNPEYTKMSEAEYADKTGEVGTYYADIYYTDIEVEFNGERVNSYSVNGEMLIKPEEALVADGITFDYNDDERMLYMRVDGLEEATVYPLAKNLVGYKTADTIWIEDNGRVIIREHAYDYEDFDDVYASYIEDYGNEYLCIIDGQHGVTYDSVEDMQYSSHIYPRTSPENMRNVDIITTDILDDCVIGEYKYADWKVTVSANERKMTSTEKQIYMPNGTVRDIDYRVDIPERNITYVISKIYPQKQEFSISETEYISILFHNGKRVGEYEGSFVYSENNGDYLTLTQLNHTKKKVDFDGNIIESEK